MVLAQTAARERSPQVLLVATSLLCRFAASAVSTSVTSGPPCTKPPFGGATSAVEEVGADGHGCRHEPAAAKSMGRDQVLLQRSYKANLSTAAAEQERLAQPCTNAMVRRRRREGAMCSCRRRSNIADLQPGWACVGDVVYKTGAGQGSGDAGSETEQPNPPSSGGANCLCVFDVDRTLTGKQGHVGPTQCPNNRVIDWINDPAYGWGKLTLSALAVEGIRNTFCGACYLGVCSAGTAGGSNSKEREYLVEEVLRTGPQDDLSINVPSWKIWSKGSDVKSPLVVSQPDKTKQFAVEDIRRWYSAQGIHIDAENVFFYGDRRENIPAFAQSGFNAREISCASRDRYLYGGSRMVGYCGATADEINGARGITSCSDVRPAPSPAPSPAPTPADTDVDSPAPMPEPPVPSVIPSPAPSPSPSIGASEPLVCRDTAGWTNGFRYCRAEGNGDWNGCTASGWTCYGYKRQGWCAGGRKTAGAYYAFGNHLNNPDKHCCVCGGGSFGECQVADVSRRRRAEAMCSCRRRSGSADLAAGWSCQGDFIRRDV